jgi:hypothetical protein
MVQVKFTKTGANSAFGSFESGDLMRCSVDLAEHLVVVAQCAEYAESAELKAPTKDSQSKQVKAKNANKS